MESLGAERWDYAELRQAWRPARQPLVPATRHNPDPGIMDGLVSKGGLPVLHASERLGRRHPDQVGRAHIAGGVAADLQPGRDRIEHRLARRRPHGRVHLRRLEIGLRTVGQLLGVEDRVGLQIAQRLGFPLAGLTGIGDVAAIDDPGFVEDRQRASGALDDRRANRQRLPESEPEGARIAALRAGERQEPGVGPAERLAVGP